MNLGGIKVRENLGASIWRRKCLRCKLLAQVLQAEDLLQLVIYSFSKYFHKYWEPKCNS